MPNYRRAWVDGGTYFFTVNTFRRQPFLTDADVRAALRAGIALVRVEYPFVIDVWVLLPDHMHALWASPPGDRDFSTRWRVIKRTVTQRCGAHLHRPEWLTAWRAKRNQEDGAWDAPYATSPRFIYHSSSGRICESNVAPVFAQSVFSGRFRYPAM